MPAEFEEHTTHCQECANRVSSIFNDILAKERAASAPTSLIGRKIVVRPYPNSVPHDERITESDVTDLRILLETSGSFDELLAQL